MSELPHNLATVAADPEDRSANGVSYRFETLSPNGVQVDSGTILSDAGTGPGFGSASIAVAPDGSFMVAYDRGDGNTEVVKVNSAGYVGVPDVAITHNESSSSTAVTRLNNGNFVVVTEDTSSGGDAGLAFRLVDAGGNSLGVATPPRRHPLQLRFGLQARYDGAVRRRLRGLLGEHLRQRQRSGVPALRRSRQRGRRCQDGQQRRRDGQHDDATMVALSDGRFVIGYTDDEDQSIKLQRYDANGNEVGAEATVTNAGNTTFSNSPHISLSADGRLLVSWGFQDDAFDDNDIEVAISTRARTSSPATTRPRRSPRARTARP